LPDETQQVVVTNAGTDVVTDVAAKTDVEPAVSAVPQVVEIPVVEVPAVMTTRKVEEAPKEAGLLDRVVGIYTIVNTVAPPSKASGLVLHFANPDACFSYITGPGSRKAMHFSHNGSLALAELRSTYALKREFAIPHDLVRSFWTMAERDFGVLAKLCGELKAFGAVSGEVDKTPKE